MKSAIAILLCLLFFNSCSYSENGNGKPQADPGNIEISYTERPFRMGFSPFPPDLSMEAVAQVYSFIGDNADLILHHFDNGVPWEEALAGKQFSDNLQEDWNRRLEKTPENSGIMVAITPLDFERSNLADKWGESEGMDLPEPWESYPLNHPDVRTAYLNYALRVIDFFNPDFMALGIEVNMLRAKNPELWEEYLDLNSYVYTRVKKVYPQLPLFTTVQYEWLRGLDKKTEGSVDNQVEAVSELMEHSDILGLSTYHYGIDHNPPVEDYFRTALSFGKPVGIAETGANSADFTQLIFTTRADEKDQLAFVSFILKEAADNNFLFVNNWVAIDFDRLLEDLPFTVRQIAKGWVHTGLQTWDGKNKPALDIWRNYLELPYGVF